MTSTINPVESVKEMHLFLGYPAAGKSTIICREYPPSCGMFLVDSDEIAMLAEWATARPITRETAKAIAKGTFLHCLQQGISVVVAATGGDLEGCLSLIREAHSHQYKVTACVVKCPRDLCLQRNATRERRVPTENILDSFDRVDAHMAQIVGEADIARTYDGQTGHLFRELCAQ